MSGYIYEIFSSFQGEGASVAGSAYGLRQIFVRMAGCNIAAKELGGTQCVWCDTKDAQIFDPEHARIEEGPGNGKFFLIKNPMTPEDVLGHISRLSTPDLHSISITGGEPLSQDDFCLDLLALLKSEGYKTYLESNGARPDVLPRFAKNIDYACIDLKTKDSKAAFDWRLLLELEIESIKQLLIAGTKVYAKIVVTSKTELEDIIIIADHMANLDVPVIVQPVSPPNDNIKRPDWETLTLFTEALAERTMGIVALSYQVHKMVGYL
ncbi:MAG: 7-carboxy-7-deazaguanine synthase QueE [Candidatus Heimdallarchaeota archaeon]|nr:7-carboxy-7-deazaguanine synthase QueE [Candidatus Heimdallarchaeota archaeon]MCK5048489.1 7-carboxy-7-deazaguanine synthase QueE [Candidatus Heimdallarchaeota archaeon]